MELRLVFAVTTIEKLLKHNIKMLHPNVKETWTRGEGTNLTGLYTLRFPKIKKC